jgi:hypothetical protein
MARREFSDTDEWRVALRRAMRGVKPRLGHLPREAANGG